MRHHPLTAATVLILAIVAPGSSNPAMWALSASPLCAAAESELDCATAIERVRLPLHASVARRSHDTLFVQVQDSNLTFVDETATSARFLHFYERAKMALLHRVADEDAWLELLDIQTATGTRVEATPTLSPDGRHFLVATDDHQKDNVIEVWQTHPPTRLWTHGTSDWRTASARWLGPDAVELVLGPTASSSQRDGGPETDFSTLRLTRTDTSWTIDASGSWDHVPQTHWHESD